MVAAQMTIYFPSYRTKYSLNEISHDSAIGLIKLLLSSGVNVQEVSDYQMMQI